MTTTGNRYNIIDPETGNLDRRIFVDQAIYDEEMEKIFGRSWLMVAHESLVPKKNDFFLSYMGQDPVIVTRDAENKIHVLLNMCRHRGNRVDARRRRQREALHVHLPRLDLRERRPPRPTSRASRRPTTAPSTSPRWGWSRRRSTSTPASSSPAGTTTRPSLEAWLGDARWYLDTDLQPQRRRHGRPRAPEVDGALQLEDAGRQLLRQLPRADHPLLEHASPATRSAATPCAPWTSSSAHPNPNNHALRQRPRADLPRRRGRRSADLHPSPQGAEQERQAFEQAAGGVLPRRSSPKSSVASAATARKQAAHPQPQRLPQPRPRLPPRAAARAAARRSSGTSPSSRPTRPRR